MRELWLAAVIGILAIVALTAVACGDDDDESGADAAADFCGEIDEVSAAVAGIEDLTADSTVDEAEAALAELQDALDDLRPAAQDIAAERSEDLDNAVEDLEQAISQPDGDATLGDAAADVEAAAANVATARGELESSVDCE